MKVSKTVGLDVREWTLVEDLMSRESLSLTEALTRLVRHGSVRYAMLMTQKDEVIEA